MQEPTEEHKQKTLKRTKSMRESYSSVPSEGDPGEEVAVSRGWDPRTSGGEPGYHGGPRQPVVTS